MSRRTKSTSKRLSRVGVPSRTILERPFGYIYITLSLSPTDPESAFQGFTASIPPTVVELMRSSSLTGNGITSFGTNSCKLGRVILIHLAQRPTVRSLSSDHSISCHTITTQYTIYQIRVSLYEQIDTPNNITMNKRVTSCLARDK